MSFFDAGSFTEPKLSMDHYREWAGQIASSYLTGGVPPTDTLVKIASSEELRPDQVAVLAGEANKAIHQAKYAAADDKYLAADFPLADCKTALSRLQMTGETKLAAVMPDPVFDDALDIHAAFGVSPEAPMDKTASVKGQMKTAAIRAEALKEKLGDQAYLTKCAADAAERSFIKQARQMVLQHGSSSAERMQVLGYLGEFVKTADAPFADRSLAKLAYVLGREGMLLPKHAATAMSFFAEKTADMKAPEELISSTLPCRVVNGTHPLYITLKTFKEHQGRLDDNRGRASIVDDKIEILHQKIRAL